MSTEKDTIEKLFKKFENQWDVNELPRGHEERFLNKLQQQKKNKGGYLNWFLSAAAVLVIGFGVYFTLQDSGPIQESASEFASAESMEAHDYFASVVEQELKVLQSKENELTKPLIDDALEQMKLFEADYQLILQEFNKNGETKQIFRALIMNFQARIQFLEDVIQKIEIINHQQHIQHEKAI